MHSVLILVAQSCPKLFVNPWTAACQASLFITNSWSSLKLMSIESLMPSNHLILCRPLFFLPSIFPSLRVISNESVFHIRWAKYWHFSFNISPSNEYSGLISFRIDLFDLLAVQRTLKSLLQNHGSKALILRSSAFFMVQLSHPYISSVQFSSVAQLCPTLCDPMNCSTPGLPVHHQLPEFTQTNVHRVSDAIQPSHPLSSPSPLAPNPSLHQSLFQ